MTKKTSHSDNNFWTLLIHPKVFIRALKVSAIVGTILILINQGDIILAGTIPPIWKILLTYAVPYSVSSYSSAALLSEINNHRE